MDIRSRMLDEVVMCTHFESENCVQDFCWKSYWEETTEITEMGG
jgi:hypothetical protein